MLFRFFFATFFWKDNVGWNNAMSQKSNIFPNQNAPSHKKIQNMKTKQKTKQFNVKNNSQRIYSILGIFENNETQIYRINSICGKKPTLTFLFCFVEKKSLHKSRLFFLIDWQLLSRMSTQTAKKKHTTHSTIIVVNKNKNNSKSSTFFFT